MQGLLDFIKTPEGQGLLAAGFGAAAGARPGQPWNTLGRGGLAGLAGYANAQDQLTQQAENAKQNQIRDMQIKAYEQNISAAQRKALEEQRVKDVIAEQFLPVTGANANAVSGVTGPRPEAAAAIGQTRKPNYQALIAQGVPPETAKALADAENYGRTKVARTIKGMGPDGREFEYQVDDYGQRVGDGLVQYRAPIQADTGGAVQFLDPYTQKPVSSLTKTMSPDGQASNALGWANNAVSRERLAFERAGGADAGKPQLVDGQWVYKPTSENPQGKTVPVAGFNPKLPESQQKQVVGVNNLSNAINEYRSELKNFGVMDAAKPDKRAAMGTKYNNMMLQAKEAYNLGVLNGPDLEILTSVITDPRSFTGLVTSNKALDAQAAELDRIMQKVGQVSGQAKQPQKSGGASGSFGTPSNLPPDIAKILNRY